MARGQQRQANQLFNESQQAQSSGSQQAQQLYNQVVPQLTQEATNPQGYGQKDLAAMNTASQQSIGGATAGAVGQGNLEAARTRNAGSFAPALDEAVRSGGRQLSQNALGIQENNANLKQAQQQAGLAGLQGEQSGQTQQMLAALGLGNQAVNTNVNAQKVGWFQNLLGGIGALSGGAQAAGVGL